MQRNLIQRRSLIKQLGAAAFLATPVFRSVFAEAQMASPKRLILMGVFGGLPVKADEPDYDWGGAMSALTEFQAETITFRGIKNEAWSRMMAATGTDCHGGGTATMFSGQSVPSKNHSLDQLVADQIGGTKRFNSLQIGVVTDGGGGMDGLFQPSINNHRTSWRNGQPQKPDQDPPALFNRLFGSAVPSPAPMGTAPDVAAQMAAQNRYARGKSLLDFLMGQVTSVESIAGAGEKAKLDAHLTALRELEKGLVDPSTMMGEGTGGGGAAVMPGAGCMPPAISGVPGVLNTGLADIQKVGADLTALAYQALNCDLTRVISFMWFSSGDQVHRYKWLNISDSHHGMEHAFQEAAADWLVMQRWTLGEIGKLASMLKQTSEGGGNMLDNSALLIGSDMAQGDHGEPGMPFPYVLIGKGGGSIRSGRQITHSPDALAPTLSHNDLLVAVGQAVGANVTAMGDADLNAQPVSLG